MISGNKWLASLNANGLGGGQPQLPGGLQQHQALDLSAATMAQLQQHHQQQQQQAAVPCSDCKELRKEVREMKHSLHCLIQQFTSFAGRWPSVSENGSAQPSPRQPGLPRGHNASPADKEPSKESPPSSLSSVEWPGELISAMKTDSGSSPSSAGGLDGRNKLSSPDSASSTDSLGLSGAKKRKLSSMPKPAHAHPSSMSAFSVAPGLGGLKHFHQPQLQQQHQQQLESSVKPSLEATYLQPLLQSQLQNQLQSQILGSNLPHLQHLLMSWQSLAGQKPADQALLGIQNPMLAYHAARMGASGTAMDAAKLLSNAALLEGAKKASPTDVNPTGGISSSLLGGSEQPTSSSERANGFSSSSGLAGSKMSIASIVPNKDLDTPPRKKPGPDDFIKEFVEHPSIDTEEHVPDRPLQIPVPEAFESDPDFRPASEEEILGSAKWDEQDWQDSVTRLAKKLAERRVFGPMLMAKATVAGTNHSNYPNLPMDGILYIETVCRQTVFPHLSRRQFAQFFRPAVKGLAARCRRIRHSLKPNGNASFLNHSSASLDDAFPEAPQDHPPPGIKEEATDAEQGEGEEIICPGSNQISPSEGPGVPGPT